VVDDLDGKLKCNTQFCQHGCLLQESFKRSVLSITYYFSYILFIPMRFQINNMQAAMCRILEVIAQHLSKVTQANSFHHDVL